MLAFCPSDKQVAYCRYISDCDPHGDGNAYFVLLQGAQGSGKTSIGVRGWASWLAADCPPAQRHICTYALDAQGRVEIAGMLQEWSTETGLRADLGAREWKIESLHGPPQRILPMPYGKALADPKFLNWNLASIFIDEAPQMPEGSRRHLVSRLRSGNMLRAVWCYNPVDRNSFKKGIHDPVSRGDIAGKVFRFKLSDNPGLPQGYRAMQEANYPAGADRIRYIEGEWAAQEGLVYDQRFELYDLNPQGRVRPRPSGDPLWYAAGVDPDDGSGVTAGVLGARYREGMWLVDEYRNDRRTNRLTTPEIANELVRKFTRGRSVRMWVIDQAGRDMIPLLSERVAGKVVLSTQGGSPLRVGPSIKKVQRFFDSGWLWIDPKLEHLRDEGSRYHYPDNADSRYGEVKPVKHDDHHPDALRYLVSRVTPFQAAPAPQSRLVMAQ